MLNNNDHCPLERVKQSDYSPEQVGNWERLARLIYHEEQVNDATGELKNGAFRMDEFLEARRRGASVARVEHSNAVELRQFGERLAAGGEPRWVRGVGMSHTNAAREICDNKGRRVFCVIDDGKPDFGAHALITRSEAYSAPELTERELRSKLKPFRRRLIELFSPVRKIEDIYD
jgi:hypothetical protein